MNRRWFLSAASLFMLWTSTRVVPAAAQGAANPPDKTSALTAVIKVYQVRHTTPAELLAILKDLVPGVHGALGPQPKFVRDTPAGEGLGTDGSTSTSGNNPAGADVNIQDQFVRTLLLKGTSEEIDKALELLKEIDVPAPQVLIEAKIVDMTEGTSSQLGVSWDFSPNGPTAQFSLGTPERKGSWDSVAFGRLSRGPITFNATLEAAIQQNKARLLASPRLVVLYNHRAKIFIGDEVTYLLGAQASQNGTTLQTGKVKVGVELNVAATANADGTINLKVNPEVGSLLQLDTLANGVSLPTIARRTVMTAVRLKDGETLVIGGLIGENEMKTLRKVPILGDLPILGKLFRREGRDKSRSELVIFLKASIVKE